jgi:phytoene dehydrogenase-like protein
LKFTEPREILDYVFFGGKEPFNLTVYKGTEKSAAELKRIFPEETEAIDKYYQLMDVSFENYRCNLLTKYSKDVFSDSMGYFAQRLLPKFLRPLVRPFLGRKYPFHTNEYYFLDSCKVLQFALYVYSTSTRHNHQE